MVVDTSALLAVLFDETDAERYVGILASSEPKLLSAVSKVEAKMVVEARKGSSGERALDMLLLRARVDVVSFDEAQADEALREWRQFGEGNHPAGLNFCDCCALALSRVSQQPLLYKGADFARANITNALDLYSPS